MNPSTLVARDQHLDLATRDLSDFEIKVISATEGTGLDSCIRMRTGNIIIEKRISTMMRYPIGNDLMGDVVTGLDSAGG